MDDASPSQLDQVRRAYAEEITRIAGVDAPRLKAAFAAVPRERFLGPPPWNVFSMSGQHKLSDPDLSHIYRDVLVALVPEKKINNGQPSGHAAWLNALDPRPGDTVVHVGAGTGYYTAILAEMVGPQGRVTAFEVDAELAEAARSNLADRPNVALIHGDGCALPIPAADAIYVNAGVTRPVDAWLDALKPGGRLVLPLTPDGSSGVGAVFAITRAEAGDTFAARAVTPTAFIPAEGGRDPASGAALARAFTAGGADRVRRLVRDADAPLSQTWMQGPDWALLF